MDRDRLVSQQGLSGVRTSTARGPSTRQVQDKRYFESLLQLKSRELTAEIARLRGQIDTDTRDQATFHMYDRRVKEMASQLTGKLFLVIIHKKRLAYGLNIFYCWLRYFIIMSRLIEMTTST